MRILAIDPSLSCNGLAISDGTTWVIRDQDLTGVRRLAHLRDEVEAVLEDYQPQLVLIESYAFSKTNRAHQIGEWGGVLRLLLHEMGRQVVELAPNAIKTFATGSHQADKTKMVSAMTLVSGRAFQTSDEADAYAMVSMAMAFLGRPLWPVPAKRVEALAKIDWPRVVLDAVAA